MNLFPSSVASPSPLRLIRLDDSMAFAAILENGNHRSLVEQTPEGAVSTERRNAASAHEDTRPVRALDLGECDFSAIAAEDDREGVLTHADHREITVTDAAR
jgi:hypothetical protein